MHQNDIVPQLPPQEGLGLFDFHHPPTEVWYRTGEPYTSYVTRHTSHLTPHTSYLTTHTCAGEPYKVCDQSGEDTSCQDSVPFLRLSAADHTWYLNMSTGCSNGDLPLDAAAAAAVDAEVWRAVSSNDELRPYAQ